MLLPEAQRRKVKTYGEQLRNKKISIEATAKDILKFFRKKKEGQQKISAKLYFLKSVFACFLHMENHLFKSEKVKASATLVLCKQRSIQIHGWGCFSLKWVDWLTILPKKTFVKKTGDSVTWDLKCSEMWWRKKTKLGIGHKNNYMYQMLVLFIMKNDKSWHLFKLIIIIMRNAATKRNPLPFPLCMTHFPGCKKGQQTEDDGYLMRWNCVAQRLWSSVHHCCFYVKVKIKAKTNLFLRQNWCLFLAATQANNPGCGLWPNLLNMCFLPSLLLQKEVNMDTLHPTMCKNFGL